MNAFICYILSLTRKVVRVLGNNLQITFHSCIFIGGYGRDLFKLMRRTTGDLPDFPLTLGRDFSGVVVSVGRSVKHFKTGDEARFKYCKTEQRTVTVAHLFKPIIACF